MNRSPDEYKSMFIECTGKTNAKLTPEQKQLVKKLFYQAQSLQCLFAAIMMTYIILMGWEIYLFFQISKKKPTYEFIDLDDFDSLAEKSVKIIKGLITIVNFVVAFKLYTYLPQKDPQKIARYLSILVIMFVIEFIICVTYKKKKIELLNSKIEDSIKVAEFLLFIVFVYQIHRFGKNLQKALDEKLEAPDSDFY